MQVILCCYCSISACKFNFRLLFSFRPRSFLDLVPSQVSSTYFQGKMREFVGEWFEGMF